METFEAPNVADAEDCDLVPGVDIADLDDDDIDIGPAISTRVASVLSLVTVKPAVFVGRAVKNTTNSVEDKVKAKRKQRRILKAGVKVKREDVRRMYMAAGRAELARRRLAERQAKLEAESVDA